MNLNTTTNLNTSGAAGGTTQPNADCKYTNFDEKKPPEVEYIFTEKGANTAANVMKNDMKLQSYPVTYIQDTSTYKKLELVNLSQKHLNRQLNKNILLIT